MRTTITAFDLQRFTRAAEQRDAAAQLSMYGADASVTIVDKASQPSAPRVLHGRDQIEEWLVEMYAREMTHRVQHTVSDVTGAAYVEACRYPDGTNVLCATVIALAGGQVTDQTVVQVWDEG
jgi:hypothetical protein